jgi:hypothetical protein
MRSQLATLVIPLTLLACGGNSSPTAATSPSTVLDLVPGAYALTITMSSSGEPVCNNGFCLSGGVCAGSATSTVRTLTTAVRLDRSGDAITVRAEDVSASFRMDLSIAANTVTGTMSGEFRDAAHQLSLTIKSGQPSQAAAVATGTVLATSVAGKIDGQLGIAGYACSNNGHIWTLVPR